MRLGFYPKLALDGIKKNRRMYLPYIFSGAGLTAICYILFFLASSALLEHMKGGSVLRMLLPIGIVVVCLFSLIFMFYSNSFLLRQRNKEFGLYHVLGMDKRNLGRIMLWENLLLFAASVSSGLVLGIALSKFAELCMVNLLKGSVSYTLRIEATAIGKTVLPFAVIYALLFIHSLFRVRCSSTLELLGSANTGERPPKANWFFAVIGVIVLGIAYYIALAIKQPLSAILWFMVAVVMVMLATYLLFIAGSVALCSILQKNKKYYYKPNHFVSVSSMVYRMKRNGAGLASICVLVTIVLVMLTSTLSLYIGAEDSLNANYPNDICVTTHLPKLELFQEESFAKMRSALKEKVEDMKNEWECHAVEIPGLLTGNTFYEDQMAHSVMDVSKLEDVCYLSLITLEDYNQMMGQNETLAEGECLLFCYKTAYMGDSITIEHCGTLQIKDRPEQVKLPPYILQLTVPVVTLVVRDSAALLAPLETVSDPLTKISLEPMWYYSFDIDGGAEEQLKLYERLREEMDDIVIHADDGSYAYRLDCRENEKITFYGLYGALFFVGILLSVVFVFATVLIIYYKQISEGYEDQKRFEVMQKVGMTKAEIRRSVNSQVRTVFFLPLLLAGIHLAVAFPIIWKLLQMFLFENVTLMVVVNVVSFAVFALIYAVVYRITSNAYYTIVSGRKE